MVKMNPIEFGTELFAKAKEMQTKTVRAMEVIAKMDAELDSMPEPFKMDFMSMVTKVIDKCENTYIALKQKPCTDAISRDMALEKMADYVASGYADSAEDFEEYSKIICQLPPVTPAEKVGQWIPVSERLPKPYTWVYATCKSLVDDRENWVIDTCYVPNEKIAQEYMISDWGNVPMLNMGDAEVIAWMEWIRPEPYKGD